MFPMYNPDSSAPAFHPARLLLSTKTTSGVANHSSTEKMYLCPVDEFILNKS